MLRENKNLTPYFQSNYLPKEKKTISRLKLSHVEMSNKWRHYRQTPFEGKKKRQKKVVRIRRDSCGPNSKNLDGDQLRNYPWRASKCPSSSLSYTIRLQLGKNVHFKFLSLLDEDEFSVMTERVMNDVDERD